MENIIIYLYEPQKATKDYKLVNPDETDFNSFKKACIAQNNELSINQFKQFYTKTHHFPYFVKFYQTEPVHKSIFVVIRKYYPDIIVKKITFDRNEALAMTSEDIHTTFNEFPLYNSDEKIQEIIKDYLPSHEFANLGQFEQFASSVHTMDIVHEKIVIRVFQFSPPKKGTKAAFKYCIL